MIRKRTWILIAMLAVLLVGAVFAAPAFADDDTPTTPSDDEVNAIAKQLYSLRIAISPRRKKPRSLPLFSKS